MTGQKLTATKFDRFKKRGALTFKSPHNKKIRKKNPVPGRHKNPRTHTHINTNTNTNTNTPMHVDIPAHFFRAVKGGRA